VQLPCIFTLIFPSVPGNGQKSSDFKRHSGLLCVPGFAAPGEEERHDLQMLGDKEIQYIED
jgi:hypothetical protein